jgi:hypothetical protein
VTTTSPDNGAEVGDTVPIRHVPVPHVPAKHGATQHGAHAIVTTPMPGLRRAIDLVLAPLAAAGSMTLTLYTAHIVFMNSPLDEFDPTPGYVVQVVAALLFALVWRRRVGRGPLEGVTA